MTKKQITNIFLLSVVWSSLCTVNSQDPTCPMPSPCQCQQSLEDSKRMIYCPRKGLDAIPAVTNSTEVFYELTLAGNQITSIPDRAFAGLKVEIIDLSNNPISSISVTAFVELSDTVKLLLESDSVPFPKNALAPLTQLTELKLTKFNIPTLPDNALSQMTGLKTLTVDECRISSIHSNAFSGFENSLTSLDLSGNLLTTIPATVNSLPGLTNLKLMSMSISDIPPNAFADLHNLEELHLTHCILTNVQPGAFTNLTNLNYLSLGFNLLPGNAINEVGVLTNLEQLDLGGNKITDLPDNLFVNMSKLAYLSLESNEIGSLSQEKWTGLENELHTLVLSQNKITTISDNAFAGLRVIEELRLDKQDLSGVIRAGSFNGLGNSLKTLSLSQTKFESRHWPSLAGLGKLTKLQLDKNQISTIPDSTFDSINSLEILILDENSIQNLTQRGMFGLHNSLQKISLSLNPILSIDECVFFEFSLLREITLHQVETLDCDCRLRWLRESTVIKIQDITILGPKCSSPPVHNGKRFSSISANDLVCDNTTVNSSCQSLKSTVPPSTEPPTTTTTVRTTTTTQPTTTTEPETTTPPFVRGLRIIGIERKTDQIKIQWRVTNEENLQGFLVNHKAKKGNDPETESPPLNSNLREYSIVNLKPNTEYTICVYVSLGQQLEEFSKVCQDTETRAETTDNNGGGDSDPLVGIIVGSVIGGLILLALIIAGIVAIAYFSRKRKGNDIGHFSGADSAGGAVPMKDFPHMGVQSKQFSRTPSKDQGAVGGYDNDVFYESEPDNKHKMAKQNNEPPNNRASDPRYHKHPPAPKAKDFYDDGGYLNPTGPRPDAPDGHKYYEIQSVHNR